MGDTHRGAENGDPSSRELLGGDLTAPEGGDAGGDATCNTAPGLAGGALNVTGSYSSVIEPLSAAVLTMDRWPPNEALSADSSRKLSDSARAAARGSAPNVAGVVAGESATASGFAVGSAGCSVPGSEP